MTPEHIERISKAHKGKIVSLETRMLLSEIRKNRGPISKETREKMSKNNNKSVPITVYNAADNTIYKQFYTIAEAAIHFFGNSRKRSKFKWILSHPDKNILLLEKYIVRRSKDRKL